MLKVLIDNEEVVADKNLQIKKEMLNPSSVILNNCYPKEWLKDFSNFTNKFYFPKNYSKCLIYEANDVTNFRIYGYCKQNTTSGKNLFNYTYQLKQNVSGVTTQLNDDGSITFSGNPTVNFPVMTGRQDITDLLEDGATYILWNTNYIGASLEIRYFDENGQIKGYISSRTSKITFKVDKTTYPKYDAAIVCRKSIWGDEEKTFTTFFQLEKGNDATPFEKYTGGIPSPNPDYPQEIETFTGEQNVSIGDKTYSISLGDLELCGIGDYKDYIYFKDNKWWVHKEIDWMSFNGTSLYTNYNKYNSIINWQDRPQFIQCDRFVAGAAYNAIVGTSNFSNCFVGINTSQGNYSTLFLNQNVQIVVNFSKKGTTSLDDFLNWSNNNETKIYYKLRNLPQDTEITDSTLLSQLELIRQRLIFAGAVLNTGDISLNPRYPHYCNLQVIDFKTLLSIGDTLDFVISNKTIEQAINMVVDAIKDYGFVVGEIKTLYNQDLIGNYSTQEKTPYDVFQYLAQISQSQWSTRMINENQIAIDFYDPTLMPTAPNILSTKEYFRENNIDDITYNYSSSDYRNKQIMLSDQVYGSIDYTETIVANGYQTTFNTLSNIGAIKSIKVNGDSKSFIGKTQSELGFSADFVYEVGKTTIEASRTWTAGDILTIVYTPLVQGREITSNTDEINRITTNIGRRGVISRYENRNDATSSYELQRIGESYIRYKGYPTITLNIKTHDKDLFEIGQITNYEAPLEELSTTYMVKSKTITQTYANNLLITNYEYELVNNFNSEKDLNFFDNQRAKATGNLKEGDFIIRNVDLEDTATIIFENLKITESKVTLPNLLDSVLDSIFIY